MSLLYRLLGVAAAVNAALGTIRLHHIPLNWLALVALAVAAVVESVGFGPDGEGGIVYDPQPGLLARVALCGLIFLLLAICLVKRNVIFRPVNSLPGGGTTVIADGEAGGRLVAPRVTACFRRPSGQSLWLHDFPTSWEISEAGAISLATGVEEGGFHGFIGAPADPSGMWSLGLSRDLLEHGLEDGILYYGLSARPALRGVSPANGKAIVLSLNSASDLAAFRRTIDEVLAESARREANFFRKIEEAPPAGPPGTGPKAAEAAGDPGDRIAWDNLIDFTK